MFEVSLPVDEPSLIDSQIIFRVVAMYIIRYCCAGWEKTVICLD